MNKSTFGIFGQSGVCDVFFPEIFYDWNTADKNFHWKYQAGKSEISWVWMSKNWHNFYFFSPFELNVDNSGMGSLTDVIEKVEGNECQYSAKS